MQLVVSSIWMKRMMGTVIARRCRENVLVITESCVITLHSKGGGTNVLEEHTISIFMVKTKQMTSMMKMKSVCSSTLTYQTTLL
jgi:hypothetical protein